MSKRTKRTPDQIIADLQAELEKQRAKQAASQAADREDIAPVVEALNDLNKQIAATRRGFSTGPQSFDTRRTSHQLWLDEINAAERLAHLTLDAFVEARDQLQEGLQGLLAQIGENPSVDVSNEAMGLVNSVNPSNESIDEAQARYDAAQAARKDFSQSKRSGNVASTGE